MEKPLRLKSVSKYFKLTSIDGLNDYCNELQRIHNNLHKYRIVDNEIKEDIFGEPYIVFQYFDTEDIEEKIKQQVTYFGEILSVPFKLQEYDDIVTKYINNELMIIFNKEYTVKDKLNPLIYRLVIYYIANRGNVPDEEDSKKIVPKSKGKWYVVSQSPSKS